MVQSFGDGRQVDGDEPEVPWGLPQIAVMLIPVWDEETLEEAVAQVRSAIAGAVRAGFADAMGELVVVDGAAPEVPAQVSFDANPTVDSRDQFAYQKYAERLDAGVPGWWRLDVPHMSDELRKEAQKRLARDEAARRR